MISFFFLMIRRPPRSTLFPSTTLSRSASRTLSSVWEQLVQNDLDNGTGVPAPLTSRRQFIGAAAATALAGIFPASLASLTAQATAKKAAQLVLPTTTKDVVPFKIRVPQEALDDLKRRLASTRWPERETVGDWSQGVPLQKAQALIAYWRDRYDWRRFEARLNAFPQYPTQIDGLGIHFIHVRSPHRNARPIILTHGDPGSIAECVETIVHLTDPTRRRAQAQRA